LHGGEQGSLTEIILNPDTPKERKLPSKVTGIALKSGDIVSFRTSGGGGWGNPRDRDRKAVQRDLLLGKISRRIAKEVYGF
jgi:N-methylhydantoinase B